MARSVIEELESLLGQGGGVKGSGNIPSLPEDLGEDEILDDHLPEPGQTVGMSGALQQVAKLLRLPGMTDAEYRDLKQFDKMKRDRSQTATAIKNRLIYQGMDPDEAERRVAPLRKLPGGRSPKDEGVSTKPQGKAQDRIFANEDEEALPSSKAYIPDAVAPGRKGRNTTVKGDRSVAAPPRRAVPKVTDEEEMQEVQKGIDDRVNATEDKPQGDWEGTDKPTPADRAKVRNNPQLMESYLDHFGL